MTHALILQKFHVIVVLCMPACTHVTFSSHSSHLLLIHEMTYTVSAGWIRTLGWLLQTKISGVPTAFFRFTTTNFSADNLLNISGASCLNKHKENADRKLESIFIEIVVTGLTSAYRISFQHIPVSPRFSSVSNHSWYLRRETERNQTFNSKWHV